MKITPKWRQFSNLLTFLTNFDKFRQISLRERLFPPLPKKIVPKWCQFSNFLPIFCQISLTETFPIKIFEFFDIFWQISTNFTERKAFSFPPNENHAKNGANFQNFWQYLTNFSVWNVSSCLPIKKWQNDQPTFGPESPRNSKFMRKPKKKINFYFISFLISRTLIFIQILNVFP